MADSKGDDPRPTENKTGPVKPPVLDLKAREAAGDKSEVKPSEPRAADASVSQAKLGENKLGETKPAGKPGEKPTQSGPAGNQPPPSHPKPAEPVRSGGGLAVGAAIAGGALGVAAAYGLAWYGLWPTTPVPAPSPDPRLAQFATAIPELETVTQTTQSELAAVNQRIGALESAEPIAADPAEPVDLGGVESDIAALTTRLESLAETVESLPDPTEAVDVGGVESDVAALTTRLDGLAETVENLPEPAEPAIDPAAIDALRSDLAALGTRLDEIAARLGTAEAGLGDLDSTLAQATATLAAQPDDIGAVLQLPLILSGFEIAFATGRPYAIELAALRTAVPDAAIPTLIANQAEIGLTRPEVIAARFAAELPDMLAGRPVDPEAQWEQGALDWLRSAIALRPAGEIEGDAPDAVITRLEGAIARRDFIAAEALLTSLPPPMVAAAEEVPLLIAEQADAMRFLQTLRASVLSGEVTQ
jgi:hypothetical protein